MAIDFFSRRCCYFAALFTLALVLLTGCGGGGGGSKSASDDSSVTSVVTFWTLDTAVGANSPAVYAPGLDAVIHSATLVPGRFGNALHLDPTLSGYAEIVINTYRADATRYLVFPDDQISVALWINPDSLTPNATYQLFGNGYYGVKTFRLMLVDGKVKMYLPNPNSAVDDLLIASQTTVPQGVWTHIAVTYDSSSAKIYFNGNVDASTTLIHPILNTYNNLFIGGVGDGSAAVTFPGSIDEVMLTSGSLSSNQVAQLVSGYRPQH